MERAEVRGFCGTRQAHVGRGDGKSPFRGAERRVGCRLLDVTRRQRPDTPPAFAGRPFLWRCSCGLCPVKFWLEGRPDSPRVWLPVGGITHDLSFEVRWLKFKFLSK